MRVVLCDIDVPDSIATQHSEVLCYCVHDEPSNFPTSEMAHPAAILAIGHSLVSVAFGRAHEDENVHRTNGPAPLEIPLAPMMIHGAGHPHQLGFPVAAHLFSCQA